MRVFGWAFDEFISIFDEFSTLYFTGFFSFKVGSNIILCVKIGSPVFFFMINDPLFLSALFDDPFKRV